jgi:hypothetical protein
MATEKKKNVPIEEAAEGTHGFFDKYGPQLLLVVLVLYVILLAIGTFAEVFKIQSILDWWIWSPS